MAFDTQSISRKHSLFRQSIRFQEVAASVFIQKIPISYLRRLYRDDADREDPVVEALHNLDEIFADCKDKSVDMSSSVEAILAEHEQDRSTRGMVLLAWRLTFDTSRRQMQQPRLVGMATVSAFTSSSQYSTDRESLSREDYQTLRPYFAKNYLYIDALCSIQGGVGRILVLAAYQVALSQKRDGLIALAFSARRNTVPESKHIFEALGFESVIDEANFTIRLYGTWFQRTTSDVDLSGITAEAVRICTRRGLTARTAENLLWRCPQ